MRSPVTVIKSSPFSSRRCRGGSHHCVGPRGSDAPTSVYSQQSRWAEFWSGCFRSESRPWSSTPGGPQFWTQPGRVQGDQLLLPLKHCKHKKGSVKSAFSCILQVNLYRWFRYCAQLDLCIGRLLNLFNIHQTPAPYSERWQRFMTLVNPLWGFWRALQRADTQKEWRTSLPVTWSWRWIPPPGRAGQTAWSSLQVCRQQPRVHQCS